MKKQIAITSALWMAAATPAFAAVSDEDFEALKAQFTALAQRLNTLESENAQLRANNEQTLQEVQVTSAQVADIRKQKKAASWTENVTWKGDFRYRYENIDEEGKDDRDRNRIRARTALIAQLPDETEVGLGFATGGDDPVSTNQTLGGGGSTKDVRLDLAYFNWGGGLEGLNVIGGKFKNVWYRPQKNGLMWDGDYNPEGLALTYKKDWFYANAAGSWLESDTRNDNEEYAWGVQAGFKGHIAGAKVMTGAGYYQLDTAGKGTFFGDGDDFFGNSSVCADPDDDSSCVYQYDYEMVQVFADVSFNVGEMPVAVFADFVQNQDADDYDTGWAAGIKLGSAKAAGTWQASYTYQDLEADAVLGLLTDSDFGGGGTDGVGHILKGGYAINKKWSLGFTYFVNEVGDNLGEKHDYDRVMLDTKFKY